MYEAKGTAAAFWLGEGIRGAVYGYKFGGKVELTADFTDCLEAAVKANFRQSDFDAIVPIPLSFLHRLLRGYNQSDYLAFSLAKRLGKAYLPRVLRRVGRPKRQSTLDEEERAENVKGTFEVPKGVEVRNKRFLLIDDIMTTGATMNEAMTTLRNAGAASVLGLALAKTRRF